MSGDGDGRLGVASWAIGEEKIMGWLDCCAPEDKTIAPIAMTSNSRLSFDGRNSIVGIYDTLVYWTIFVKNEFKTIFYRFVIGALNWMPFDCRSARCRIPFAPPCIRTVSRGKNRPICSSTRTIPWTGSRGATTAFARARAENKPIFLSIGYSTCHWCHVMERESFEDDKVGAFLNEHFVSIKVDREERPDVDKIYMTFVQSTTGSGGWPLNVFLTPDLKPFFGGTYFPPDERHGRPSFLRLLEQIAGLWRERKTEIVASAGEIHARLESAMSHSARIRLAADNPGLEKCGGSFQIQLRSGTWRLRWRAQISATRHSIARFTGGEALRRRGSHQNGLAHLRPDGGRRHS